MVTCATTCTATYERPVPQGPRVGAGVESGRAVRAADAAHDRGVDRAIAGDMTQLAHDERCTGVPLVRRRAVVARAGRRSALLARRTHRSAGVSAEAQRRADRARCGTRGHRGRTRHRRRRRVRCSRALGYVLLRARSEAASRRSRGIAGVDAAAVTAALKQAYGRLRGIETAARNIAVPEFGERLTRITDIGRDILAEIERDPRDASRARRFLNIYLDSAERVTTEYARTHRHLRSRPLEQNFRQLLIDMERTFDAQHKKLLENDADDARRGNRSAERPPQTRRCHMSHASDRRQRDETTPTQTDAAQSASRRPRRCRRPRWWLRSRDRRHGAPKSSARSPKSTSTTATRSSSSAPPRKAR